MGPGLSIEESMDFILENEREHGPSKIYKTYTVIYTSILCIIGFYEFLKLLQNWAKVPVL